MQYIIVGTGGQGVLFSSRVLGHIAIARGENVQGSEVHGMAQRGGSVVSHFKVGDYASPLVTEGQADVLLAFDQNEAARSISFLRPGGVLVVNLHDLESWDNEPLQSWLKEKEIQVLPMMGYDILKEHMGGKFLFMNVLILGALCGSDNGGVTLDEVLKAVGELAPAKFKDDNLKVVQLGYEAVSR